MPLRLFLETILLVFLLIMVIVSILKKGRINIKYSLVWFISILLVLILSLIPNCMALISNLLGFQTISNMIFAILIFLLIFISLSLTIIVSGQKEKIRLLIQEVSMLKQQKNDR